MKKSNAIVVAFLFSIITFTLITFLGTVAIKSFNFQPTILGQDLVYVHTQDHSFKVNVPWTGVIIFGLSGGSIQLLINKFSKINQQIYGFLY